MALRDFQEKRKLHKLIYSWPVLFTLAALIIWGLTGIVSLWRSHLDLKSRLADANERIGKIRETRSSIEKRLESLNSSSGLEQEARGRFNLKKQGEEVVIFLDDNEPGSNKESIFNSFKFSSIIQWIEKRLSF